MTRIGEIEIGSSGARDCNPRAVFVCSTQPITPAADAVDRSASAPQPAHMDLQRVEGPAARSQQQKIVSDEIAGIADQQRQEAIADALTYAATMCIVAGYAVALYAVLR